MKVTLLTSTENALKTAFTAIRTCYSPNQQDYVWNQEWDKYVENNNDHIRLINQIVSHGHTSTLEHIQFTFAINDVSRSLLAQLTRHRVGFAYSVQSQRYVKLESDSKSGGFEYVTPKSISDNEVTKKLYDEFMVSTQELYNNLRKNGIVAEDARYILPNAATTNITLSCNLRSFMDLYSKRNKNTHAQWEISELVEIMLDEIVKKEEWVKVLIK